MHLERLVPVAGAHRGGLGEPPGRVVRRRGVRVRELVPAPSRSGRRRRRARWRARSGRSPGRRPGRRAACGRRSASPAGRRAARPRGSRRRARARAARRASAAAARRARGRCRRAPAIGSRSVVSPVIANAQPITGAAPAVAPSRTTAPRRRSGTTANQNSEPDREREQRAARVGQHQRDLEQRDPGPRQRVHGRPPGAPRAEPQQRQDPQRGRQPDRVPVVERRAQPRVDLLLRQRARGTPWSAAPSRRRRRTRARSRAGPRASGPGASRASAIVPANAAR